MLPLSLLLSLTAFQDYTQPLIRNLDISNYVALAKKVFDFQWRFLASLRSIDPLRDPPHITSYKERQAFSTLMAMQRQANPKDLSCWAMTETTSYNVYGVRALVVNSSNFSGRTNSTTFRDR